MFNNLKLSMKMSVCTGSILFLLLITAGWAIFGLDSVVDDGIEVSEGNRLRHSRSLRGAFAIRRILSPCRSTRNLR